MSCGNGDAGTASRALYLDDTVLFEEGHQRAFRSRRSRILLRRLTRPRDVKYRKGVFFRDIREQWT